MFKPFFTFTICAAAAAWGSGCSGDAVTPAEVLPDAVTADVGVDATDTEWNPQPQDTSVEVAADAVPSEVCATTCGGKCVDLQSDPKNCGSCGHDCLGGGCAVGVCQAVVISSGGTQVANLTMDDSDIYWFERFGCIGCERLMRAPRNGSAPPVVLTANEKSPDSLVLRTYGAYWTEPSEGTIRGMNKAGGGLVTLVSGQDYPSFIAFNADDLYWSNYGRNKMTESLWRRPTVGAPVKLANTSGQLAFDDSYVYWLEWAVYPSDQGSIRRVSKFGGGETTLTTLKGRISMFLQLLGTDLYWLVGDEMFRMPKAGGTPTKVASIVGARGLVLQSDGIYDTIDTKSVSRLPLAGGPAVKLLEDADFFRLADVDAKAIVYLTNSSATPSTYSIKLRAK